MNEKINIVIVDDHMLFVEGLVSLLRNIGKYKVVGYFEKPSLMLQYLNNNNIKVDLIILDINMSELNGLELLQYLSKNKFNQKKLIITSYNEPYLVSRAIECGVNGFLLKNTDKKELSNAIVAIMEGDLFISKSVTTQSKINNESHFFTKREVEVLKLLAKGMAS